MLAESGTLTCALKQQVWHMPTHVLPVRAAQPHRLRRDPHHLGCVVRRPQPIQFEAALVGNAGTVGCRPEHPHGMLVSTAHRDETFPGRLEGQPGVTAGPSLRSMGQRSHRICSESMHELGLHPKSGSRTRCSRRAPIARARRGVRLPPRASRQMSATLEHFKGRSRLGRHQRTTLVTAAHLFLAVCG